MTQLRKFIFIGFATATLGIASISAFANKEACGFLRYDSGKFAAQMEKRQAELHGKLKLITDQEAAWKTFTEKMKPSVPGNKPDWSELSALHAPERMERMLSMMKEHESRMADRVAVVKEFYAVLTPEQQKLFDKQFLGHSRHRKSR